MFEGLLFLKFLVNFTLLKYVKTQRSYGFLITKELIFGFQILDLKDHFSASLKPVNQFEYKLTLSYTSSFGAEHVCLPCCMALNSLLSHHLYLQNLNNVSNGSSKIFFYVPNFAPVRLALKLSCLNSIESEIALRKLLFLGRMITENKLTPTKRNFMGHSLQSDC